MSIERLLSIMQRLRDPHDGCEWDLKQSFESIAPYTLEEAYEVVDAIQRNDLADLQDELGDLLLQVVFHSQMATEQGAFSFDDVANSISEKMIRRHPHVFGDVKFENEAAQKAAWEAVKAQERAAKINNAGSGKDVLDDTQPSSALDGIANALPALKRADKIQKRAARVGFDWKDAAPVYDKIQEEIIEVQEAVALGDSASIKDELGDLLFSVVNLARHYGVDSESALSDANQKFSRRFKQVERLAGDANTEMTDMSLAELDVLWGKAKNS